jgi:hypothetical protein
MAVGEETAHAVRQVRLAVGRVERVCPAAHMCPKPLRAFSYSCGLGTRAALVSSMPLCCLCVHATCLSPFLLRQVLPIQALRKQARPRTCARGIPRKEHLQVRRLARCMVSWCPANAASHHARTSVSRCGLLTLSHALAERREAAPDLWSCDCRKHYICESPACTARSPSATS